MSNIVKLSVLSLFMVFFSACDCEDSDTGTDPAAEVTTPAAVEFQIVGSLIEGLSICLDNGICNKTDVNGMVAFEQLGDYTFKIKDINITTLTIDSERLVISAYDLFDANETLAKQVIMMLHAFDKSTDPGDENVLLTFSSYIPDAPTIETFIRDNSIADYLTYAINDHTVEVDFANKHIVRDGTTYPLAIPEKAAYERLNKVADFIETANDKEVMLDYLDTKYLLKKRTLTSFSLGDSYDFNAFAKDDQVIVKIYDRSLGITDEATLIDNNDTQSLLTSLVELRVAEE